MEKLRSTCLPSAWLTGKIDRGRRGAGGSLYKFLSYEDFVFCFGFFSGNYRLIDRLAEIIGRSSVEIHVKKKSAKLNYREIPIQSPNSRESCFFKGA